MSETQYGIEYTFADGSTRTERKPSKQAVEELLALHRRLNHGRFELRAIARSATYTDWEVYEDVH